MQPSPGSPPASRRLLAGIVLLGAFLRVFHLGHQSLWIDEILTLIVATPKPGYPIWQLLRHNIHGPLHTFVVFLFRQVSTADAWLRLPSALAGIASVPLLYVWVRRRFGERVALGSAFLLAINPLHVFYSQELRNYAFLVFFVMAACVQLDRVCERWSKGRALGLAALVAAAVLSNFSATFAFMAQTLAYGKRAGVSRRSLSRWAGITVVVAALISPWIYRVTTYVDFERLATPVLPGELDASQRLRGETTFRPEAVPYAAFGYSVGFSLGPSLRELHDDASLAGVVARHGPLIAWVALLYGSLVVVGVWRRSRAGQGALVWEIASYIAIPLVATLLLNWQNAKAFNVRYVIVGLPMYTALLALGAASLSRRGAAAAVALVTLTSVASLGNYYFNARYAKEDVRDAVRGVEQRLQDDECIFAPTVWQIVNHYRTRDEPVLYVFRDPQELAQEQMRELFKSCRVFWYVRARPWVDDPDGRILAEIETRCRRTEAFDVPGVSVARYEVVDSTSTR